MWLQLNYFSYLWKVRSLSSSASLFLHSDARYSTICMESENHHDSWQARKVLWTPRLTLLLGKLFFSPFRILHPIKLFNEFFDSTGNNTTIRELKPAASESPPAVTATLVCDCTVPHAEKRVPTQTSAFITAAFHLYFSWEGLHPFPFGMYLNTTLKLSEDE